MYVDYARRLRHAYPHIQVQGENYPPTPINAALSTMLQMVFMFGLLGSLAGAYVLPPLYANWITENRTMLMLVVLGSNFLAGQLLATGAFEVTYNDVEVFSKLKAGHLVDFQEIRRLLEKTIATAQVGSA